MGYDENDFMEIGDTGLVPIADGWFLDVNTGYTISPEGIVFDEDNEIFYDPTEEEATTTADDYRREYDWY